MYSVRLQFWENHNSDLRFSHNADVIIDRTCLIAADLILIYVTWYTLGRKAFSNSHHSFVGVLLQDGAYSAV